MRIKSNESGSAVGRNRIRQVYMERIGKAAAKNQMDSKIREMTPEQFVRYLQTVPEDQIMQVSVSDGKEDAGEA